MQLTLGEISQDGFVIPTEVREGSVAAQITSNILLNALLLAGPDPGTLKQAHPLMMPSRTGKLSWEEGREETEESGERGEDLLDEREPRSDGALRRLELAGDQRKITRPRLSIHPRLHLHSIKPPEQHSQFVTLRSNIRSSSPPCA